LLQVAYGCLSLCPPGTFIPPRRFGSPQLQQTFIRPNGNDCFGLFVSDTATPAPRNALLLSGGFFVLAGKRDADFHDFNADHR